MSKLLGIVSEKWIAFSLPDVRENDDFSTYTIRPASHFPSLDAELDDEFRWLMERRPRAVSDWAIGGDKEFIPQYLKLREQMDFSLPNAFDNFLKSAKLHKRIRSYTGCYLQMPDFIVRTTGVEQGYLLHFLSDQQWCCHWNLYVNQDGDELVLGSDEAFGFEDEKGASPVDLRKETVWICARSFKEFIYRYWIENEIAFRFGTRFLTPEQQAYIDFYQRKA